MPLPTFNVEKIFTSDELNTVDQYIQRIGKTVVDDSCYYPDSGQHGKHVGKNISDNIFWDYHAHPEIQEILTPKLEALLQKKLIVTDAHTLESNIPYLIHTDVVHNNRGLTPEYTIIIPLETYNSITICFNEWAEESNDFEMFKQNYQGEKKLRMDPKFCASRLSHLHPKDLMYLTLHDTFEWVKGSVFAMDRRYFHCSDNFLRRGLDQKRAIILWTLSDN
jgi:hypothetical protein